MTTATRRACLKAVIADTPPKVRQENVGRYRRALHEAGLWIGWPNGLARFCFLERLFSSWKKEMVG